MEKYEILGVQIPGKSTFVPPETGLIEYATLLDRAERHMDMIQCMKKHVLVSGGQISTEDRNLFAIAYKSMVSKHRDSIRKANSLNGSGLDEECIDSIRKGALADLVAVSNDAIQVLDLHLLPNATDSEARVFYFKMRADYLRYAADATKDNATLLQANTWYDKAWEAAKVLPPTNPLRLGLALNLSVFKYEALGQHADGVALAQSALADVESEGRDASDEVESLGHLLRENLDMWLEK